MKQPSLIMAGVAGLAVAYGGIAWVQTSLDNHRTPRRLQADVRDNIARTARQYPGVKFSAMSEMGSEPVHFVLDIAEALQGGGWDWQPYTGRSLKMHPLDGRPAVGFTTVDHIEVQAAPDLTDAGRALAKTLKASRLGRVEFVTTDGTGLGVIVGSKP